MFRQIEENLLLFSAKFAKQKDYWLNKLPGNLSKTKIFDDYPIPVSPRTSEEGKPGEKRKRVSIAFSPDLSQKLLKLSKSSDLSLYIILLAGIKALIYRYTNREEITVISPIYGENVTDETINDLLFIYDTVSGDLTFKDLLLKISQSVIEAYENQDYPQEKLMEILLDADDEGEVHPGNRCVSTIECLLKNIHSYHENTFFASGSQGDSFRENRPPGPPAKAFDDLSSSPGKTTGPITNNHDRGGKITGQRLTFTFEREDARIRGDICFNGNIYREDSIKKISGHLTAILEHSLSDVNIKISLLSCLSPREKHQLIEEFNKKKTEIPETLSVYQCIEREAEIHPDRTAVVVEDSILSYGYLNQRSNRWAGILEKKGMQQDETAAIILERGLLMVIVILAVWKARGAYIPIEPQDPVKRISEILKDSDARVLITQTQYASNEIEEYCKGKVIKVEEKIAEMEEERISTLENCHLNIAADINNLAYIIYTSGSTGKPKGAMVEHIGMMNHIQAKIHDLGINEASVIAQNASHTFDISVWQFFAALTSGGKTIIYPHERILNPGEFLMGIQYNQVTILEVVPTYLSALLDFTEVQSPRPRFPYLKYLLVTGDMLFPHLVRRWFEKYPGIKMVNAYGPTEASDDITHWIMEKPVEGDRVPIGQPVQNLHLYMVDLHMNLCPPGVKGEICVSGIGVGRGYLNNPEKTSQVFTVDPFINGKGKGIRLYKTGDLGRWTPDGALEFFGRKDHQVKLRGYRIELGEIENKLREFPQIHEAVVVNKQDEQGNQYLCAYIVPNKLGSIDISEVKNYLASELPEYMVPPYVMELDQIPITPNGKVNRSALPHPQSVKKDPQEDTPQNEVEKNLLSVWSEVLGIEKDRIGLETNFFELGGDSIKAIQISARLMRYRLKVEIRDVFLNPTIRQLGACARKIDREIPQGPVTGAVMLTPIQRWFFGKNFPQHHHFNQSLMIYSKIGFSEMIVGQVLEKLVEHHDALRMVYKIGNDTIIQENRRVEGKLFDLEAVHLNENGDIEKEVEKQANRTQASIDLGIGPLLKVVLFKTTSGDHLLMVIHHLVIDGVSWRILIEDFAIGYQQLIDGSPVKFQEKTDSYQYWAKKINEYAANQNLLKELEYWKQIENAEIKSLPRDQEIPPGSEKHKRKYSEHMVMSLEEGDTEKLLKEVNQAYHTEINDILLTALGLTIKEWCGQQKILLNLEGHGRENIIEDIDISRTVGWFTTLYPVILDMSPRGENTIELTHSIKRVKETLNAVPHNGIGYGILKHLTPLPMNEELSLNREPEISFNYLGQVGQEFADHHAVTLSEMDTGENLSPELEMWYALDINGSVINGRLNLEFTYNRYEYERKTIKKLIDSYKSNLVKIIEHCVNKVKVEDTEMTLSDFSSSNLNEQDLEAIYEELAEA